MQLINIGFGNMVSASRVISIVSPESAPIKRIIQEAKDNKMTIDATLGRRTRAVIMMDSGHVVLSSIQPETIAGRCTGADEETNINSKMKGMWFKMMVLPTVTSLLDVVDNRFRLVIVTAKRARQIALGSEVLTEVKEESPVTLAANEIAEGKVTVC